MSVRLLATKFYFPPRREGNVTRPRLLGHLHAGLAEFRKLTLVSAPAGYGKTTVIVDWIHALPDGVRVAWVSLDEGENELARFLGYCIAAFQRVDPALGKSARDLLDQLQLPPSQVILDELLNDLAQLEGQIVMVLDDYHTITQPQVHQALEYFLEHQPPQVHLAITSREDPPLPLARLRAGGQMTEIRAHDLRFTLDEAAQFFNQSMRLELAADTIRSIEARTEGWAAGLQLAALALQKLPDPHEFIQSFRGTHRFVLDYLAEEVLFQQEPAIRDFLLQTAVLERFNALLCSAVTGRPDSQELLARLEQANLFIIPLDDERNWYRYHHLFADYLRTGLPKSEQARLQEKASLWCEANGLIFEAVKYAFASGKLGLAADVIERVIQKGSAWSGGQVATLVGWLDSLPEELLRSRPALSLHASRAWYLSGRIELSERFLDLAEQSLKERPAVELDTEKLLAIVAVYRGSIAGLRGELQVAIERINYALDHLAETEYHARARATESLGLAYELAGDFDRAGQLLVQASDLSYAAGVAYLAVAARCGAALVQINQGKLSRAAQTCQEAIRLAGDQPIPPLGFTRFVLAEIAWEKNELDAAEQLLQEALNLSRRGGLIDDQRYELMALARLERTKGDLAGALAAVEQAFAITRPYEIPRLIEEVSAHRARVLLASGMMDAVGRWAQEYCELRRDHPVEYLREYEDLTLARVYLARGEIAPAVEILAPLYAQAHAGGRVRACMEAALLLALAEQQQDNPTAALEWLEKALALAEPEGFLRLFLDEAPSIAGLLPKARPAAPHMVDQLLQALPTREPSPVQAGPRPAKLELVDPLSEQELRVLHLIVAGKSNREIAEDLFISLGTAKWHVHNILQKLEVKNRPQAIARARELGIE